MTNAVFLEDFSVKSDATDPARPEPVSSQPDTTSPDLTYDDGYEAGWNDAVAAEQSQATTAQRGLGIALEQVSFTYFEARQHVLRSLEPLLHCMVNKILPEVAKAGLSSIILQELQKFAEGIEEPIEILCPPEAAEELRRLCAEKLSMPVTITPEPSLDGQQVLFRYADGSADLNLTECLEQIRASIEAFFEPIQEGERAHG